MIILRYLSGSGDVGRPPLSNLGIGWILLICLVVFVLIILWAVWYYRFVARRIYGRIHEQLHEVAGSGNCSAWDAELVKRLKRAKTQGKKRRIIEQHSERVNRRVRDLISYAERSSTIHEDERQGYIEALTQYLAEHKDRMQEALTRLDGAISD